MSYDVFQLRATPPCGATGELVELKTTFLGKTRQVYRYNDYVPTPPKLRRSYIYVPALLECVHCGQAHPARVYIHKQRIANIEWRKEPFDQMLAKFLEEPFADYLMHYFRFWYQPKKEVNA